MSVLNLRSFEGQVVIVTRAASGIGKEATEFVAARFERVVCFDLNETGLRGLLLK